MSIENYSFLIAFGAAGLAIIYGIILIWQILKASTGSKRMQEIASAKVVITVHWTHTAYVDMILKDKVDFDILGWDWYADMGLMNEKKLTDGTLLVDKLRSYKKPIILAEVNGTATDKQDAQADFIANMAEWAYNSGFIKGFFVHELSDTAEWPGRKANFFGLVKVKKIPGGTYSYDFGDPKDAFYAYQKVISKYSN